VRVVEHPDPESFLARALPFLEEHEDEHALPLGLAHRLARQGSTAREERLFVTVQEAETGGEVIATLLREGARKAILSRGTPAAARALGAWAAEGRLLLPGAVGPVDVVRAFAEAYAPPLGLVARRGMETRAHVCRAVVDPPAPPGAPRLAEPRDHETLLPWLVDFARHTTDRPTEADLTRSLDRMVSEGRIHLWEAPGGEVVSMAARMRDTRRGASVSWVYTPPERRRRGAASALVAALSRRILDSGKEFCALFTDLSNPVSNEIYARIGYVPVADWEEALFEGASGGAGAS
jgi:hypothetical protein